jgi:hypothetical protein
MVHPKIKAAGLAGAAVTLLVAILGAFGVDVPTGVSDAAVAFLAALAGYLKSS